MIRINNLTKKFGKNLLFENLNLTISSSGLYLLKGNNGVGKTTLLNIIYGLEKDFIGSCELYNVNSDTINAKEIYYITQKPNLPEELNFNDVLRLFDIPNNHELIDLVGLNNKLTQKIKDFSNGEKQRLSLLLAVFSQASIILCDEPTDALDEDNKLLFIEVCKKIGKDKIILLVSHDDFFDEHVNYIIKMSQQNLNMVEKNKCKDNYIHKPSKTNFLNIKNIFKIFFKNKNNWFLIIIFAIFFCFFAFITTIFLNKINYDLTASLIYNDNFLYVTKDCTSSECNDDLYFTEEFKNELDTLKYIDEVYYVNNEENNELNNMVPVTDGNTSNPQQLKTTFSSDEIINSQLNNKTVTQDVSINPFTGEVTNSSDQIIGYVNDFQDYSTKVEFLPVDDLIINSQAEQFFNQLNISGELPTNNQEILIPDQYAQIAFNTTNYSEIINQQYITICNQNFSFNEDNQSYEWNETKCNDYLISGVYEVTPTSGSNLYLQYSDYAYNHFSDDYQSKQAIVKINNDPVFAINSLKDSFADSQNIYVAQMSENIWSTSMQFLETEQKQKILGFTLFMVLITVIIIIIFSFLIIWNCNRQKRNTVFLIMNNFGKKQIIKFAIIEAIFTILISLILAFAILQLMEVSSLVVFGLICLSVVTLVVYLIINNLKINKLLKNNLIGIKNEIR